MIFVNAPVGKNEDICSFVICLVGFEIKAFYCLGKPGIFIIKYRNNGGLEAADLHVFYFENIG